MSKKILLIEDEKDFVIAVKSLLEASGFEAESADNGLDGLTKAKSQHFDLIVTDVMMPKMDGYKVCRMLKFDKKYRDIPVIMLTAKGQEADKITGEQCGADAYILKSGSPDILISKIKELLK